MGKPKTPEPPSPKEQAAAQTSTNISTALANNALGQINQKTPYGSQTYTQTGSRFIPDENGQVMWYNASTGQYSNSAPKITGYNTVDTPVTTTGGYNNRNGDLVGAKTTGGTSRTPIYEDGWSQVRGYNIPTSTLETTLDPAQQAILDQNNIAGLNLSTLAAEQSGKIRDLLGNPMTLDGAPAAGTAGNYTNLREFMSAPELATTFGDAGDVARTFGDAGDITRSYGANDFSADRDKVENALMARMQPSLDQNKANLRQQLVNRGLQPGSVAYNRAFDEASRAENDARLGAILSAGQEQSRLVGMVRDRATFENSAQQQDFSQQLARGQFGNAAQQQIYDQLLGRANFGNTATQQNADNAYRTTAGNNAVIQGNNAIQTQKFNEQNALRAMFLNEQYALRNQQINETTGLLSGSQVQNPNFSPTQSAQMPTVDMAGLMQQDYQNRVAAAQAKSAGTGAILGGLASLFSLSDKTAKRDIKKVGKLKGHNLYEYRYRGEFDDGRKHIGVMAQEAEKKRPDAVRKGADGLRRVNYGALFDVEVPVGA